MVGSNNAGEGHTKPGGMVVIGHGHMQRYRTKNTPGQYRAPIERE